MTNHFTLKKFNKILQTKKVSVLVFLVTPSRFELPTFALKVRCSTN